MAFPVAANVESLSAYIEHIESKCQGENVLFRGQPLDLPLLPKIARLNLRSDVLTAEKRMLDDFKRQALPFLESRPDTDWDWLAFAQHFGMATRLLDWTLNPLAALWFAIERPARQGGAGVIWYFQATEDDFLDPNENGGPFSIDHTRVFRPRHITRRIIAQSGWFTAHKYLHAKKKRYIALEFNVRFKPRLTKLAVPASAFPDLRRDLDRCGINAASLYGGIDGLCRHVEWLHSFLDDEVAEEGTESRQKDGSKALSRI